MRFMESHWRQPRFKRCYNEANCLMCWLIVLVKTGRRGIAARIRDVR